MARTVLEVSALIQHRYVALECIASFVVDLLARLIDPALRVHTELIVLERQDQLAVRAQSAIPLRTVALTPAPFDTQRQICFQHLDQLPVDLQGSIAGPMTQQ